MGLKKDIAEVDRFVKKKMITKGQGQRFKHQIRNAYARLVKTMVKIKHRIIRH